MAPRGRGNKPCQTIHKPQSQIIMTQRGRANKLCQTVHKSQTKEKESNQFPFSQQDDHSVRQIHYKQNISEDVQEMPYPRSTAFQMHQKRRDGEKEAPNEGEIRKRGTKRRDEEKRHQTKERYGTNSDKANAIYKTTDMHKELQQWNNLGTISRNTVCVCLGVGVGGEL